MEETSSGSSQTRDDAPPPTPWEIPSSCSLRGAPDLLGAEEGWDLPEVNDGRGWFTRWRGRSHSTRQHWAGLGQGGLPAVCAFSDISGHRRTLTRSIISMKVKLSHSVVSDSLWPRGLQPTRLLCPRNSPGKSSTVGCHFLLQGIFPTQGSNPGLRHCRQSVYHLSCQGAHHFIRVCKMKIFYYPNIISQLDYFCKEKLPLVNY